MKKVSLLTLAMATLVSSMASAQMSSGNMNSKNMMGAMSNPSLNNMENPMYKPEEGMFYSKTNFNYTPVSDYDASYSLTEEWGYGISEDWAVSMSVGYGWMDSQTNLFGQDAALSDVTFAGLYRAVADHGFIWDITAGVRIDMSDDMVSQYSLDLPIQDYGKKDTAVFLGTKMGVNMGQDFTMAFDLGYSMATDDKRNYAEKKLGDTSYWNMGLEGQVVFSDDWTMNLGYKYKGFLDDDGFNKAVTQNVIASVNCQASEMALLSLYVDYDVSSKGDRLEMASTNLVGADGDDNRWSYGARVGLEF